MAEMSQRQFAALIGVTHRAVQKAITAGRIRLTAQGKIDPVTAVDQWKRNTDESKRSFSDLARNAKVQAAQRSTLSQDQSDAEDDELVGAKEEDPSLASYRASRAAREQLRFQREQIELDQLRGSLIEVSEAQRLGFTALRTVRDAVMNVPVRVKDIIAAETDTSRIEELLVVELMDALGSIDLAAIMRDEDPEDDDGC
ncbi:hypothetical protein PQQ51_06110 [Paraburkholderia xenovorans]|uniref:hypothetical protein n=1 Tax=Paraburkholderia xenovorans TaxID=36873 RepID=UPI0038BA4B3E